MIELKDGTGVLVGVTESLIFLHLELSVLKNSKFCILNNINLDFMSYVIIT